MTWEKDILPSWKRLIGKADMKKEELIKLKKIAEALLRKEDPLSGALIAEDSVLSIPEVEQYNQQVYELLEKLLGNADEKIDIPVSDEPISISKFCYRINEGMSADMKKVRGEYLLDLLESMGYLYTVEENGTMFRRPTVKGNSLGIEVAERENKYGNKYRVNLYTKDAQRFILNHLDMVLM